MEQLWDLLADNNTVVGRLATTAALLIAAFAVAAVGGRLVGWRGRAPFKRYYARKARH